MLFQRSLENLKILRLQYAVILGYLLEVGVHTPLSNFMADGRLTPGCNNFAPVIIRPRWFAVDNALQAFPPSLNSRCRRAVEITFSNNRPSRSCGIQYAVIF